MTLGRSKRVKVTTDVYCLNHTGIHENTLDPYGEGYPTCFNGEYGLTPYDVHRTLHVTFRKGDYEEEL